MTGAILPLTLTFYIMRHTASRILLSIVAIIIIFAVFDTVEIFRQLSDKAGRSTFSVFSLELTRLPSILPTLIPYGVLIGLVISFQSLRISNQIIVARTNGLSLLKIITGPVICVLALAIFTLAAIDPIASATRKRYEQMEQAIFGNKARNLTVSTEGIWLRDRNDNNAMIIHGDEINTDNFHLNNALVYTFAADGTLDSRYYPEKLSLQDGYWQIDGGKIIHTDGTVAPNQSVKLISSLSQDDLTRSNKRPETIPIVELWRYIDVLNKAGLPSLAHSSYLYYQLSLPLILAGMVMIVGSLTLSITARVGWGKITLGAIVLGLGFYFAQDFLYNMGKSGRLSPLIAGFAPGVLMIAFGTVSLIRADDK